MVSPVPIQNGGSPCARLRIIGLGSKHLAKGPKRIPVPSVFQRDPRPIQQLRHGGIGRRRAGRRKQCRNPPKRTLSLPIQDQFCRPLSMAHPVEPRSTNEPKGASGTNLDGKGKSSRARRTLFERHRVRARSTSFI
jgi:hypothetical protein